jgi:hypothetical protein
MYGWIYQRFGEAVAQRGTVIWYALLLLLVVLSFVAPAGEFRYSEL